MASDALFEVEYSCLQQTSSRCLQFCRPYITQVVTETQRTQIMGVTRVAALRRDVAHPWELAVTQIVHAVTLHGVPHHVV